MKIAICYRRTDVSPTAGRMYDFLVGKYGKDNIFIDLKGIRSGQILSQTIFRSIVKCNYMFVLIGKNWHGQLKRRMILKQKSRLFDEDDYVRSEIEFASKAGLHIIPILIEGGTMPLIADLPRSLHFLNSINAVNFRADRDFSDEMEHLLKSICWMQNDERYADQEGKAVANNTADEFSPKLTAEFNSHLPYLRRYARALFGNQICGDALIASTLQHLLENKKSATKDLIYLFNNKEFSSPATKIIIFKNFVSIYNKSFASQLDRAYYERLGGLFSDVDHQVWILLNTENFSEAEICFIFSISNETLISFVRRVSKKLSDWVSTNVLIIEDEPLIAADLEAIVENLGHRVIGIARTRLEAINVLLSSNLRPGLIIADIQLADGSSGLDAVNDITKKFSPAVIFATAYPERFLTGEKPEPAFLIAKPLQPVNVMTLISQALHVQSGKE